MLPLQGLLPFGKALALLLKHWIPPLLPPPSSVQSQMSLCTNWVYTSRTPNLDSEHTEKEGGSNLGDRRRRGPGPRIKVRQREVCITEEAALLVRARAGGERGVREAAINCTPGWGSDRVTASAQVVEHESLPPARLSSFCRAAGPAAAADDDPVPRTLPSGTRWPSHHAPPLPLPELVRPAASPHPPPPAPRSCRTRSPGSAAPVVVQGPEPRVQVG